MAGFKSHFGSKFDLKPGNPDCLTAKVLYKIRIKISGMKFGN